jgi:hypothetical protein
MAEKSIKQFIGEVKEALAFTVLMAFTACR